MNDSSHLELIRFSARQKLAIRNSHDNSVLDRPILLKILAKCLLINGWCKATDKDFLGSLGG